ncbi:MAG: preprotein translocase subunit SecE [Armatimonadetes bacterium]|nr:preprotein translocase subunit SecE [Armatimonadota bacterium]
MSKPGGTAPQAPASIPIPKSKKGLGGFFGDVSRELKKVHWPPVHETNRLTGVVLAVGLFLILLLFGLSEVTAMLLSLITKGRV